MRLTSLFMATIALAAFWAPIAAAQQTQSEARAYQGPSLEQQREAMARLAPLIGTWSGLAQVQGQHATTVHQTESVAWDLDGLVLVIHGLGFASADHAGEPIFRALAVVSYDDQRGVYEFRAYNAGRATTAQAQFLEDGALRWSIDGRAVQIRYTIHFDDNTWREVGEMSRDGGANWARTIEMDLRRAE